MLGSDFSHGRFIGFDKESVAFVCAEKDLLIIKKVKLVWRVNAQVVLLP